VSFHGRDIPHRASKKRGRKLEEIMTRKRVI
jgi:hypothetical protein